MKKIIDIIRKPTAKGMIVHKDNNKYNRTVKHKGKMEEC